MCISRSHISKVLLCVGVALVLPSFALACSCSVLPVHMTMGFGESLDVGGQSTPVIHTGTARPVLESMPACTNITSCGVVAANGTTLNIDPTLMTGFTDLIEQVGETSSSGLADRLNVTNGAYRFNGGHFGFGEEPTYADLSRNGSPYNVSCSVLTGTPSVSHSWCNKMIALSKCATFAVANGTYCVVDAETYTGGEADNANGESATQAEADMVTEVSTFWPDVQQVEATYEPGHVQAAGPLIIDQHTSPSVDSLTQSTVSLGWFQAAVDYPSSIYLSVAKYPFQYAGGGLDHRHLLGMSEDFLGEYQAKAIQGIVINKTGWQPPQPTAAHLVDSTHIHLPCAVPVPPLVIDTSWVSDPNGASGLTLIYTAPGAPSPPTITGVAIAVSGTEIDLTMSGTVDLTQSPVVMTAPTSDTGTAGCTEFGNGTCTGIRTSIHDSDPATPILDSTQCTANGAPWGCCTGNGTGGFCDTGRHLYNPLVIFQIAVTT